ncbi:MAG: enoyl-CoA hydratase/isomerase family protein [Alphaproteobacteria bacterium]|nr:enoyl-CoA hydratase/isomerase family protein [Alphaproteobacteria bacterium]
MSSDNLKVEIDGGVARLILAQPEKHNAFDDAIIAAFTEALERVGNDASVRVVVLLGEGKSFSAGADLEWMRRMADYGDAENLADARALAAMLQHLNDLPKPTIARVQGATFGGGVGLVACCDIAIASEAAIFCLSEARLGLTPSTISPYVVAAMGAHNARRYFLTAERFDGVAAERIGLVHMVTKPDQLDAAVDDFIAALLRNGPMAIAESKDLIRRVTAGPVDSTMIEDTAQHIARVRAAAEGKEGVRAFLEKRPAAWQRK